MIMTGRWKRQPSTLLLVLHNNDGDNDRDDDENDDTDGEADPSLLPGSTRRGDRLVSVPKPVVRQLLEPNPSKRRNDVPSLHILLHRLSLRFNGSDRFVLLFHKDTHLPGVVSCLDREKNAAPRRTSLNSWASSPSVFSMRLMSSCRSWTSRYADLASPYRLDCMS